MSDKEENKEKEKNEKIDIKVEIKPIGKNPKEKSKSVFQTVVIGDSKVGKTTLIKQGLYKEITEKDKNIYRPTQSFELQWNNYNINEDNFCFQFWDVSGTDLAKNLAGNFYKSCTCVFLVYAINDRKTFDNLENWINNLKKYIDENTLIVLIGNKTDLENERQISTEEAEKFQEENEIDFLIELNPFTEQEKVDDLFNTTIENIYKTYLHSLNSKVLSEDDDEVYISLRNSSGSITKIKKKKKSRFGGQNESIKDRLKKSYCCFC
jgi:Ras-related protein Rab-11A